MFCLVITLLTVTQLQYSTVQASNALEDLFTGFVKYNSDASDCNTNSDCANKQNEIFEGDWRKHLNTKEINRGTKGSLYRGKQNVDVNGNQCLNWPEKAVSRSPKSGI